MSSASTPTTHSGIREWAFRGAFTFWILLGAVGVWYSPGMGTPTTIILAIFWFGGLSLFLRDFLISLFGPVLVYDMIRMGRRKRTFWIRSLYAAAMGLIFTWLFVTWSSNHNFESRNDPSALSRLASTFFGVYMFCQFALVCLLTPATVATTITDEKERRTIEFMLATDLRDREIIFGKLATRVGNILLLLLAGLPVLTMVQFFGGIEPDEVIAGFAGTFVTVLSIAAVSMAASVMARKSRDAIALTNLMIIAYCCLSGMAMAFASILQNTSTASSIGLDYVNWEQIAYPFVCGNPFYMIPNLLIGRGFTSSTRLFNGTMHYLAFHFICFVLFITWSGLRLRSIALAQTFGGSEKSILNILRRSKPKNRDETKPYFIRPEIGDSPVLWKEIFVDSGIKLGWFARIVIALLVFLSFVPLVAIIYDFAYDHFLKYNSTWNVDVWEDLSQRVNSYVRVLSPLISTILFLAVAVRGAGSVLGERDRHSLDVLLTTPLSAGRILWGKWWGCILGLRLGWCWLFSVWLIGLLFDGLTPVMLLPLIGSTAVYAGGFAWIGIYCSTTQTTSLRATLNAIIMSLMFGGGYLLFFVCGCLLPLEFGGNHPGRSLDFVIDAMFGFSPPAVLSWLPMHEFNEHTTKFVSVEFPFLPFWVIGLLAWIMLNRFFARLSTSHFRKLANRKD